MKYLYQKLINLLLSILLFFLSLPVNGKIITLYQSEFYGGIHKGNFDTKINDLYKMRDDVKDESFQYDALLGIAISRHKDFNEGIDYLKKRSDEAKDKYVRYTYDFSIGLAYLDSRKLNQLKSIADSLMKKYPNEFAGDYLLGYRSATISKFEESNIFLNRALAICMSNPDSKYYYEEKNSIYSRILLNLHNLDMKDEEVKIFRLITSNFENFDFIGADLLIAICQHLISINDFENSKRIIDYIENRYPELCKESILFLFVKKFFYIQYNLYQKQDN